MIGLDTAADSTCLPLEDDVVTSPSGGKEGRIDHSLQILNSLGKQRATGVLCDITLSAQGFYIMFCCYSQCSLLLLHQAVFGLIIFQDYDV